MRWSHNCPIVLLYYVEDCHIFWLHICLFTSPPCGILSVKLLSYSSSLQFFTEQTFHSASTVWMCELEFQFIFEFTVEFSTKHHLTICKHEIISRFGNIVPSSLCDGRVPRRASVACQLLFSDQIDIVWFNLFVCYWFCLLFCLCIVYCFVYVLFCLCIIVFIWWALSGAL